MKTNKYIFGLISIFGKVKVLHIVIFILLNISLSVISQNNKNLPYRFGVGVGVHVSGNSHGGIYDLYGSLYNGKSLFSLGTCMQKRSNPFCGARMSFSYMLTNRDNFSKVGITDLEEDDNLQLYFFSFCQYLHNAQLSSAAIHREKDLERGNEPPTDFSSIKLSTIEAGVGFGLNIKLRKKMTWGNYIGISTFYRTNYNNELHVNEIAPALIIGTSFGLNFL